MIRIEHMVIVMSKLCDGESQGENLPPLVCSRSKRLNNGRSYFHRCSALSQPTTFSFWVKGRMLMLDHASFLTLLYAAVKTYRWQPKMNCQHKGSDFWYFSGKYMVPFKFMSNLFLTRTVNDLILISQRHQRITPFRRKKIKEVSAAHWLVYDIPNYIWSLHIFHFYDFWRWISNKHATQTSRYEHTQSARLCQKKERFTTSATWLPCI